jgi:hypothetical protein
LTKDNDRGKAEIVKVDPPSFNFGAARSRHGLHEFLRIDSAARQNTELVLISEIRVKKPLRL